MSEYSYMLNIHHMYYMLGNGECVFSVSSYVFSLP